MTLRLAILLISGLSIISCFDSSYSDRNIESRAQAIVDRLDNDSINIFKEWNYTQRGKLNYWSKIVSGEQLYSCTYSKETDTTKLIIFKLQAFLKDFPWNYKLDTLKYNQVELSQFDNSIHVKATMDGYGATLDDILIFNGLFISKNPFNHFSKLASLKGDLEVFGISSEGYIGDFIQFYLSSQYILTYMPDNVYFNLEPKAKDFWMKEFEKGKMIKKNWNLRKLEHPLDNG